MRNRWSEIDLKKRISERLSNKKYLGYIEGPPTLNGEPHMGHLRGRVMKDLWYRFATIRGEKIDFRGGWDCQGLPVELQAEKELGLSGNKTANLKLIGEERLVQACKDLVKKYHAIWRRTDELLGLLIDDSKSYWTYSDSYIEREWQILKTALENNVLDEAYRVTPFCPSCQTPLSAGEVALGGYELLDDPSMYFKMRLRGTYRDSFLVAWTTMPFTVVTDELVGVKPDSEYCFVEVESGGGRHETWLLGKERLEPLMKELRIEKFAVKKSLIGRELEGLRYEHPLSDALPKQAEIDLKNDSVHCMFAEEFVDASTGSGLVHMSPANGEDDFEVAQRRGIPVFNPIDGEAKFTPDAGPFAGLFVREADEKVGEALKARGLLLKYGKLRHEYPVCWRSGHRLVWLARREYYYFVDRLGERAIEAATRVQYFFEQPRNRFIEIIKEKRPWCISRERVWGSPLPIWKCDTCGEKEGLFSRSEIVSRAKSLPDGENFELHRPWIDRILLDCPKCGGSMHREPFVLDTWHNSGASPFSSLTDEEYKNYVPVPFLTEGIDQTRGWAYSLLIENVLLKMHDQAPYESFLFQGHVLDPKGQKMSKSKGNYIAARDLLEEGSVDLVRLYLVWKASPIDSINFIPAELKGRPYQILNTLYHMHVFYLQNSTFDGFSLVSEKAEEVVHSLVERKHEVLLKQDKWLLSRLQFLIGFCTESYLAAKYQDSARAIEQFLIEDLSQTYVPIVRGEMWEESAEGRKRRKTIYAVLGFSLLMFDKLFHPIAPYLTDYLAKQAFQTEAITLEYWPASIHDIRDEKLEVEFDLLSKMISLSNSARMKAKVKRRWPLRKSIFLVGPDAIDLALANRDLLLEQTNLEELELFSDPSKIPLLTVEANLNVEVVAPKVKAGLKQLQDMIKRESGARLYNEIMEKGKAKVGNYELSPQEVQFSFESRDPKYAVAMNNGMVVALDASRDEELVAKGLLRDLARNLQSLRKEKGFNPTDVLSEVIVSGLGEQNVQMLRGREKDLSFLVRVRNVKLYAEELPESAESQSAEIDGTYLKLEIIP